MYVYICMYVCMYVCMWLFLSGFHAARADEGDAGGRASRAVAGRPGPQSHYEGSCLL